MTRPIEKGEADMVLGSQMLVPGGAKAGGMLAWKRVANRFLTAMENLALDKNFSECHTGYRAYSRRFLETIPFLRNSNGFVFDTEAGRKRSRSSEPIAEVPVQARYPRRSLVRRYSGRGAIYGLRTNCGRISLPPSCVGSRPL